MTAQPSQIRSTELLSTPMSRSRRSRAVPSATRESLLIVDDSDKNRELLARRFLHLGYQVTVVDGGRAALDRIASSHFDAVLLDVMMPDLSGLQVLEEVRRTHSASDLPIIMATALDQTDDIVTALRLGANDYVSKPFDFEVVFARLETQLSLRRAKAEVDRLVEELERRNRFIQKTFGRYLRDDIVATLLQSPDTQRLGGELRDVTILMSDLRGFTLHTEGLPPERVMALLNNYLGAMARIIASHGGMVDEFIGDGILAIFGAPERSDHDADNAIACAIEMQRAMAWVNAENVAAGLPALEMGIAVHAGSVVVGNIGSEDRAKYGVVGSHVNLTARIESSTVGGQVLISESARQKARAPLRLGATAKLRAKGFREPIEVHELHAAGPRGELSLPVRGETMTALSPGVAVSFFYLTDKHVDPRGEEGEIVAISPLGCEIRAASPPPAFSDLRLCLDGEDVGEVYGKVISSDAADEGRFRVRFTSIAPSASDRLKAMTSPNGT